MDILITGLFSFLSTFFWMWLFLQLIGRLTEKNEQESVVENFVENTVLVKVEQIEDVVYLYNAQDGTFIGQGRTSMDIDKIVKDYNKQMIVIEGEQAVLDHLNSLVKSREISLSQ